MTEQSEMLSRFNAWMKEQEKKFKDFEKKEK